MGSRAVFEGYKPTWAALWWFLGLRALEAGVLLAGMVAFQVAELPAPAVPVSYVFLPLMALVGLYISFGYIAAAAIAFFAVAPAVSLRRPNALPYVNALPLLFWGVVALLVVYGTRFPVGIAVPLVFAFGANFAAGRVLAARVVVSGMGPNNSSKPTPLRGAA